MTLTWRKASTSAAQSNCVELAWRKSSRSGAESNCVELASSGAVRDSKNSAGPILSVDLATMLSAIKAGRIGPRA